MSSNIRVVDFKIGDLVMHQKRGFVGIVVPLSLEVMNSNPNEYVNVKILFTKKSQNSGGYYPENLIILNSK